MPIDEEYLDNLLNSMTGGSGQGTDAGLQNEDLQEKTVIADIESEGNQETADNFADAAEESWKTSLDELLAAADTMAEESMQQESKEDDDFNKLLSAVGDASMGFESSTDNAADMDVTQMIDSMDGSDDDLAAIRDLLVKSDNNEMITGDPDTVSGEIEEDEITADTGKKKKSKSLFSFLKNRKKKKSGKKKDSAEEWDSVLEEENTAADVEPVIEESAIEEPAMEESVIGEESAMEEMPAVDEALGLEETFMAEEEPVMREEEEQEIPKEPEKQSVPVKKEKGKSKGFLETFFEAIFGEEEEPEQKEKLDENGEILKELEMEDKKQGKKKEKKKKEKTDKKKAKAGEKKEKKPKPEKVKKQTETPDNEPGRRINPKFLFVLVAFCATVIAAVNLLSIFLTDYADKQNARIAFYSGQYEDVYLFLYNRTLNQEEQLLYNRADTVLQLQRRLDSYHANKKIGKEAEALDSLLLGVGIYRDLIGKETYGASDELDSIYRDILNCLGAYYGVNEEMAIEINAYDREAYTQKVYALVNGTDYIKDSFESTEASESTESSESIEPEFMEPQDILPDEEDIIDREMQ